MRVIIFKIIVLFLLFGAGHNFYANTLDHILTSNTKHEFSKKRTERFNNKDHNSIILEDTDVDIEEEHSGTNLKSASGSKFLVDKNSNARWYLSHDDIVILRKLRKKSQTSMSVLGQSLPVYITHQVFRI